KEPGNVVAVDERNQVVLPGEISILGSQGAVQFREIVVVGEHVANGRVEREIEQRHAAVVGKLESIVVQRIACPSQKPFTVEKAWAKGECGVHHAVFPSPGDVLHGIDAEGIHTVLLKLLQGGLQVSVDGRIFLVQIRKAEERVVLELVAVVEVGDIRIVMKDAVGIVVEGGNKCPIIKK